MQDYRQEWASCSIGDTTTIKNYYPLNIIIREFDASIICYYWLSDYELPRKMTDIYVDAADLDQLIDAVSDPRIQGITTNPTLMHKAGVTDYTLFAKTVVKTTSLPVSFEIFCDDLEGMRAQALRIASWGHNIYVKIPIQNTKSESTVEVIEELTKEGVRINVTAILSTDQIERSIKALKGTCGGIVSVFAGRIADTGRDPKVYVKHALARVENEPNVKVLWASTREVYNYYEARDIGCDIITMPPGLLQKLEMFDQDLDELSLETVNMFYRDAIASGFRV